MNDNDAPTRELFARLTLPMGLLYETLTWCTTANCPTLQINDVWVSLDTIRKLRAACELLDIPWVYEVPT